jgi:hypothetical protein
MFRSTVILACVLSVASSPMANHFAQADVKNIWQDNEIKKLKGRWTAFREEKNYQEKVRRVWVELEFTDRRLKIVTLDENRHQTWNESLAVIDIERVGPVSRLILGHEMQKKAEVYYDFVSKKLILVGRIVPRPFEGFQLTGEYTRAEQPK